MVWAVSCGHLDVDEEVMVSMRLHERTGRPLGAASFITAVETQTGRMLRPKKPGPKGPGKDN